MYRNFSDAFLERLYGFKASWQQDLEACPLMKAAHGFPWGVPSANRRMETSIRSPRALRTDYNSLCEKRRKASGCFSFLLSCGSVPVRDVLL